MINQELSEIFSLIGDYLEMNEQSNFFRIRAFRKASEIVSKYPQDLGQLNYVELVRLNGIGNAIAKDIIEFANTGKIQFYEELKASSPIKIEELNRIQGLGPKKIKRLYYELGVKDPNDLKAVAEKGLIAKLPGFGEKSEQNILQSLQFNIVNKERTRIDVALKIAHDYINYLKQNDKNIIKIKYAGSLRRREETVGDIDIIVSSKDPKATSNIFIKYPNVEKVLGNGETKSSVWLVNKIQIDLRVIPLESFGTTLQYFTGNVDHNVLLRKVAIKKGLKLSEYGLFNKLNINIAKNKSEKWVYKHLLNNYIPPIIRTDNNEIDCAINNCLPNLIKLSDIKGDLQMHSTFSDGVNTMEEMVLACIKKGYKYMGFTDHFGNLAVANAVSESEFNKYLDSITVLSTKYKNKIKIYSGAEVNIKPNGDLDFNLNLLSKLNYVLASIHSSFNQNVIEATKRYLNVLQNPLVKIIGHPTGRLIGKRPGIEFNYLQIFTEASQKNVAIEINAHPMRLDVNYKLAALATKSGCKICINTDAHSVYDLDLMKYGVYVAKKAWVTRQNLFIPEF